MAYTAFDKRYKTMNYRSCGKWGLKLSVVSLGLWHNFGFSTNYKNAKKMIHTAFDSGITCFDLANNYGPPMGSAETSFGKILAKDLKPYRDEIVVTSKAGYYMWPGPYGEWGSRKYLMSSLDQSLKRMNLDYVDIFYSHRFDPNTPLEETMAALADIVKQGKALYAGISSYSAVQTEKASALLESFGVPCLIHQPSYSMLNRWIESEGLLDAVEENGMGCTVFSPLAQGMLSTKYLNGIPSGSRASIHKSGLSKKLLKPQTIKNIKKLNEIAESRGQSLAQMALAWCLRDQRITSVLIGASSPKQITENVSALNNLNFTAEELKVIDTYAVESGINIWAVSSVF